MGSQQHIQTQNTIHENTAAAKYNIQNEMTLKGYVKPLDEYVADNQAVRPEQILRQVPCDAMVHFFYFFLVLKICLLRKWYKLGHLIRFQIPPIYDGKHLVVYAILAKDAYLPKMAEVTAVSAVGPLSFKVNLNEINSEESKLIHR